MSGKTIRPAARTINRQIRAAAGTLALTALLVTGPAAGLRAETAFEATYAISLAGLTIGTAETEGSLTDTSYVVSIKGTTSGVSRLLSDASAMLRGSGRIAADRLLPETYDLETREGEFETHVRMKMNGGTVGDLLAVPSLHGIRDRVPLEPRHKRNIVDPIAAFFIVAGKSGIGGGQGVCRRTIKVFDGWQRFDVRLSHQDDRNVDGTGEAYDGKVIVCAARYLPLAGHRSNLETTRYMAENGRLEAWFAPIDGTPLLVPYRLLIGTKLGDLVVEATRFVAKSNVAADPEVGD